MNYDIQISTEKRQLVNIKDFAVQAGKITLLLGESGIGKTLICRSIYGLLAANELNIRINNQPFSKYVASADCKKIKENGFFVFQEPSSHLNPLHTLSDQLNEGDLKDPRENDRILAALFPLFNQEERKQFLQVFPKPYRPSGGEKQRFLIAMAFKKMLQLPKNTQAQNALFIFDEPTGNLDNNYRNLFLKMLISAQLELGFTTLLITHDYSMISEITGKYRHLLKQISFQELRRSNGYQVQSPFSTDDYLDWLEGLNSQHTAGSSKAKPLLELDPQVRVFGRQLQINNADHKGQSAPLLIYPGDAVYLKGASGTGKTTLAKIMMGLQRAESFQLKIADQAFNESSGRRLWRRQIWAKKLSMVFQHADEALNLSGRVKDIFRGLPLKRRSNRDFLVDHLKIVFGEDVDESFLDQPVVYLSGGQKQRLNLLRALILETDILILDEPFNGLDFNTLQKVLSLLQKRREQGRSFLLISHNEEIIERFIPPERVYYLQAGKAMK